MPQGQESREGKSKRFVNEDGEFTFESGESPALEIEPVEPINPFKNTFSVAEQTPLPAIEKPDIPEPEVSITAGDIVPVIPNILMKVIAMNDIKTTAIGIAGGALIALGDYIQSGGVITFRGAMTAIGFAVLGYFAGDKKK